MNIYEALKHDHNEVKQLLASLEKNPNEKDFNDLYKEVVVHAKAEEKAFYDKLKGSAGHMKVTITGGAKEHDIAEDILDEMKKTDIKSSDWKKLLSVLKKSLEDHILKEEVDMFPLAKSLLNKDEEEKIKQKFEEEKEKIKKKFPDS